MCVITKILIPLLLPCTTYTPRHPDSLYFPPIKQQQQQIAISYALWELGFWGVSIPICVVGYYQLTGHWPDFANKEDMEKVGAEAFAFVNFARLAVPLRIGLALSTTPWIDENIVQKFMKKGEEEK